MYEQIAPYIRRAWYSTLQPGRYLTPRVIFDYELLYIKEGSCIITVEDQQYSPSVGDIFLFRPGQVHSILVSQNAPLIQPHIHFDLQYFPDAAEVPVSYMSLDQMNETHKHYFRPDILPDFLDPFPTYIHLANPKIIEQMLVDVIYAHGNPSLFPELNEKWLFLRLFYQLLFEISMTQTDRRSIPQDTAVRARLYLDQNLSTTVSLDELSKVCNVSKSYLIKVFKEAYHITPLQHHLLQRINRSKYLLKCSNQTVTEIALAVGFDGIHSFSRCFKQQTGLSPTEFRKGNILLPHQHSDTLDVAEEFDN